MYDALMDCLKVTLGNVTFVNLTPHAIRIVTTAFNDGGEPQLDVTIPPSGLLARVEALRGLPLPLEDSGPFAWMERRGPSVYGNVEGLPEPAPGTIYLVSVLVLQASDARGRTDVHAPDTGRGAVRDAEGRIIATTCLIRAA